jgi:selenocysteine lyase/cysteine desulfurase
VSDPLAEVRALFDPEPGLIYLDSATYGLPPRPTIQIMQRALERWQAGAADWVSEWDIRGETCRTAFASLIGRSPEHIALVPSASVGVGTVAATLTPRDEVVIPRDEFNSVLFPILVAARHAGVSVNEVDFDELSHSIGPRTTLVAFSLVQSQSGRAARQTEIVDAALKVGAHTLIDATHAVPFVAVDPRADFVVCAAYKHLLSPRGVAFLAIGPKHWDATPAWLANWRSTRHPYAVYYGGPLDQADGAGRFDVSLAWFDWAGAAESLELLADWQARGFLEQPLVLTQHLAERLGQPAPTSSIVSIPVEDAERVRAELAGAGIKAAVRAGSVRLSTHVYNTPQDIEQAVAALARFVPQSIGR